jgi:mannose-6-phosphate isomerase-like protein (cupin superfamily)
VRGDALGFTTGRDTAVRRRTRLLGVRAAASALRPADARASETEDEVLYVLRGTGRGTIGGDAAEFSRGVAAYVARGTTWKIEAADGLELLSVQIRDPLGSNGATHALVAVDEAEAGEATAGRMFRLLATPERGCASATQFIGYIPVGRAPDHFHKYDEVVYVLEGEGALHIDGETAPLHTGSCVHLPKGLVHCLENGGPGEMHVLGVFRPAGSPAEAYYPDGTRAQY